MEFLDEELELLYKHHPWHYDDDSVGGRMFVKISEYLYYLKCQVESAGSFDGGNYLLVKYRKNTIARFYFHPQDFNSYDEALDFNLARAKSWIEKSAYKDKQLVQDDR